jgi:predicted DNA-binding transcriptional regulator AlpA
MNTPSPYTTAPELAARFHCHKRTIDRWVKDPAYNFPAPIISGKGATCLWRISDVTAWEAKRFGVTDEPT